ncbi:zinc metalloprotease [Aquimarina sp. RZ0]|uniref:zinc metalloprotease n=1 Tax=Aquimarina sp. RZ0 TaxID=2607730 RepID=UPI0011F17F6D|nr:zinc metalloprotease [Aquimarina sp. RZ0]KAA1246272.1 zinc metalloprotease [Aquimarina sp. RZ0]
MKQKILSVILLSAVSMILLPGHTHYKKESADPQITTESLTRVQKDSIRKCYTMELFEKHLSRIPSMRSRIEGIENRCQAYIEGLRSGKIDDLHPIFIPVVVHVIYNNEVENISDAQIQSQIDVLNQDFNKTNTDSNQVPEEFLDVASDIKLNFKLDRILRISSKRASWGTNDQMKFTSNGGSNAIEPRNHLNIWVCTIGGGILGYAQFPGDNINTDGVVISSQYFGTEGSAQAPFNKGRTGTHEVGHWLNLRHIWGDGNCTKDDFVDDTPISGTPNYGCPNYPTMHCDSNDMTMNYMDYVDDACMYMFTKGQVERMKAVFAENGPRKGFCKNQG